MCNQCEELMINGTKCHETGCPDAWKDRKVECKFCGSEFVRDEKFQKCCGYECEMAYAGY